ncbi:hypothetical protein ACSS6W_010506 [Trichoderma asperelloides]
MFSLNIGLLSELIDMYHGREASDPRDKIYALLGMSSNSYSLTPDHNITWQTLFERVIRHIICKQVSVTTWHDREVAVIKSKGCALGHISSVKSDATWDYKQHVIISNKEWEYLNDKNYRKIRWTLQTPAKFIQRGDIFCLLQGASQPTIIRQWRDYFIIVAIAVNPINDIQAETSDNTWKETLQLARVAPRDFLLVWDWTRFLTESEEDTMYSIKSPIPKDGRYHTWDYRSSSKERRKGSDEIASSQARRSDPITEDIVKATAGNAFHGKDILELLLNHRGDQIIITEDIVKAAAENWKGKEVVELLLDRRGDQITITEDIIKATISHMWYGKDILQLLLNRRGDQITITDDFIIFAAKNRIDKERMELLLNQRGDQITITEDIIEAAAHGNGKEVMELLLDRRGDQIYNYRRYY